MSTFARILLLHSLFIGLLTAASEFLLPKNAEARTPIAQGLPSFRSSASLQNPLIP